MKNTENHSIASEQALAELTSVQAAGTGTRLKRMVKRNLHQWHRIIGLITVVPVIFWTISGLMHPFMSHWFKPTIAHEFLPSAPIQRDKITLSLQEVLTQNKINRLRNFRLVTWKDGTYYQVKGFDHRLQYFNARTGQLLPDGDRKYAEYLARYFIGEHKAAIQSLTQVTEFTSQYRYVNRLLPVWKVSFERGDQMDAYVETEQSRLANFNESRRKAFLWVFNNFHNWDFLAGISNNTLRYVVMISLLSIIILSAASGLVIYGLMWKKFQKPWKAQDKWGFLRKYHRQIGLATALVTFTFAFSGAYHATRKLTPDDRDRYVYQPIILTANLGVSFLTLPVDWSKTVNFSLATVEGKPYYQAFFQNKASGWGKQQLDKAETMFGKQAVIKPNLAYYDAQTASLLPDGVMAHVGELVQRFITQQQGGGDPACCDAPGTSAEAAMELPSLLSTAFLTKFDREYGFINKRLPVVKMALDTPDALTYYVEPATSRLSAKVNEADRREGVTFAVLHKYFLMDWAGKNVRDLTMMLAAAGVLVTSLFGLAVFLKMK